MEEGRVGLGVKERATEQGHACSAGMRIRRETLVALKEMFELQRKLQEVYQ